jgi:hypothetical protein
VGARSDLLVSLAGLHCLAASKRSRNDLCSREGEIAALSGPEDDAHFFQISAPVQPGNSGGALVDEPGNVVGVVSGKLSARATLFTSGTLPENLNYAVKSSFLLSFLESVPDVTAKLKDQNTKDMKFDDVVEQAKKGSDGQPRAFRQILSMTVGKAHGKNRAYQVHCRDVLLYKNAGFSPHCCDGIDVPFDMGGTTWTLNVALKSSTGALLVAECRRREDRTKQDAIAAFAHKVELLRKKFSVPLAGAFLCKSSPQIGAVKHSHFEGITVAELLEGNISEGFSIGFHHYDSEREKRIRHFTLKVATGKYSLT